MQVTLEQQQMLEEHVRMVLTENERTNLTRIGSFEEAMVLHVEDSLAGVPEVKEAPEGRLADLGSGAGFPGIPLSITTEKEITLVESVGKKTQALDRMVHSLSLDDTVKVFNGRAEDLALERPQSFSVVTARALSSLPSLLELASPLLMMGGHLVAYKSADLDEELKEAQAIQEKLGMVYRKIRSLELSNGAQRTLVVFEKVSEPQVKLPRRPGMAQKRPYR